MTIPTRPGAYPSREDMDALDALTVWALTQQTAIVEYQRKRSGGGDPTDAVRAALVNLLMVAQRARGIGSDEALAWVALAAGASDDDAFTEVQFLLTYGDASGWRHATFAVYKPLGTLGPLAYGAGLGPVEAVERATAGTLDVNALRALAALRGWRIPVAA